MFKHILVPTDGSAFSNRAAKQAIKLAATTKARITAIHVVPGFHMVRLDDEGYSVPMLPSLRKRVEDDSITHAGRLLEKVAEAARRRGVHCRTVVGVNDFPYDEIIKQAKKNKCDLIIMASHGRRGLAGLLLGSETVKVLTHSGIPVLVVH